MSMEPSVFEQVVPGNHARNAASPTAPTDVHWRGILLAAPRIVRTPQNRPRVVPLCMYQMVDVSPPPAPAPMVVVVGATLPQPLRGPLVDIDDSPVARHPGRRPIDPAELQGLATGGYANHNLAALLRLPDGPGVYTVHIELGAVRSNDVTIEVAAQP